MSSELVRRLCDKHKHSAEAYGCEEYIPMAKFWQAYADLSSQAADLIESQAKAIEEMRGALLYIALEMPPQETASRIAAEMVIKAEALASHSKEGEQR